MGKKNSKKDFSFLSENHWISNTDDITDLSYNLNDIPKNGIDFKNEIDLLIKK